MRTVAGRLVIAALLFAASVAFVAEARESRRAADRRERIATLQYARGSFTLDDEAETSRLRLPIGALQDEGLQQRALASYWRAEYQGLTNPTAFIASAGRDVAADAGLLFVAANAAFRDAQGRTGGDRAAAVERLDRIVDAYAEVLRTDPAHADAAFNYEFVSRYRDRVATGKPPRARSLEGVPPVIASPDLPIGPTIHGVPGGPPEEIPGSDFRTIAPMPYDEREETDPGQGPAPRRRG